MVVKIWLNKVNLLCALAAENPQNVTSIMDANINAGQMKWVVENVSDLTPPGALFMPDYGRNGKGGRFFGHINCTERVKAYAKWMAVRGQDCGRVMEVYDSFVKDAGRATVALGSEWLGCTCTHVLAQTASCAALCSGFHWVNPLWHVLHPTEQTQGRTRPQKFCL